VIVSGGFCPAAFRFYGFSDFLHLYIELAQTPTYTDEELLALYRSSGDNAWLGTLLQRYTLLLLGVAMKYLKDKVIAEDAVQQVFEKALLHLPKEEIQNFKGWLYILMRNHCLQQLRDRHYNMGDEALQHVADTTTDKELLQLQDKALAHMEDALQELNEEQRSCIVQFYLEKKSYQQITDSTGFSFQQVKSYIQNGKRNLKLILLKALQQNNG
jgi:RNA polymerase sigma factor (sigma-70 family)